MIFFWHGDSSLQPTHPYQPNPFHPFVHWRVPSTALRGPISPIRPLALTVDGTAWSSGVRGGGGGGGMDASLVEVQVWISMRSMGGCIKREGKRVLAYTAGVQPRQPPYSSRM